MTTQPRRALGAPLPSLSVLQGVSFLVGVVLGIGIFKAPQMVAANVDSGWAFLALWLAGGAVTLVGALCYAELGSARPSAGGEYRYLSDAYGMRLGVMFAWARGTVIQTGAIAAVAFVLGDYATALYSLGAHSSAIYAVLAVVVVTAINLSGTSRASWTQGILTGLTVAVLAVIVLAGLLAAPAESQACCGGSRQWRRRDRAGAGVRAADLRRLERSRLPVWRSAQSAPQSGADPGAGALAVTAIYMIVNITYLRFFGLEGIRASDAIGADMMNQIAGRPGVIFLSLAVCAAAFSTLNATVFTGARTFSALGRDVPVLARLGLWDAKGHHPVNSVLLQSAITLALVAFGAVSRDGFSAMVEYAAPVFWFFLLLVGLSLFVFRARDPEHARPFSVPLYPLTPIVFCAGCAYMLYSSLAYTGNGSWIGIGVLLLGLPLLLLTRRDPLPAPAE